MDGDKEIPKDKPQVKKNKMGLVVNCSLLNVRRTPTNDGVVEAVLNKDTKVKIDEALSTDEFYKITTNAGVSGFCKKQFVKLY